MLLNISSNYTNYTYTIDVFVPKAECPKEGFPIVYVLDGISYFDLVRKGVELQSKNSVKTGVQPAIVVGINHDQKTMQKRRFYDFTAPSSEYIFPQRMQDRIPEEVGGASNFRLFIEKELKPFIYAQFDVNKKNETLFGHSLGGYYTLWSLFQQSEDFGHYIAISPSIWWNGHELLTMADTIASNKANCHSIFIGVGELEGFMVTDAKVIYEKLKLQNLNIAFYEALDENHASVVPTVLSRSLRFVNKNV